MLNFEIHFCEYNRQNPPKDRIYRPGGSGDYLFLLLKTPMKFYLNQELNLTRENACILYTPQTMQHYEAVQKFRNSYIHFSCSAPLAEHFRIPLNTIFYPGNPDEIDEYIRELQEERIASQYSFRLPTALPIAWSYSHRTYGIFAAALEYRVSTLGYILLPISVPLFPSEDSE